MIVVTDYKELYLTMFRACEEAIQTLMDAQRACEERYAELSDQENTADHAETPQREVRE